MKLKVEINGVEYVAIPHKVVKPGPPCTGCQLRIDYEECPIVELCEDLDCNTGSVHVFQKL